VASNTNDRATRFGCHSDASTTGLPVAVPPMVVPVAARERGDFPAPGFLIFDLDMH